MPSPPTINRYAVTLLPTGACLAWLNSFPSDDRPLTLEEVKKEPTVYLIPQGEAGPDSSLRHHFKAMFEEELSSWYTDPEMWPKDRSFKNFKRFFTVQIATMVFDLGEDMIVKEL